MDRSLSSQQFKNYSSHCIHTKNIYSLLDLDQSAESYRHLKKHLDHCSICSDHFKIFQIKNEAMRVAIPIITMDRELKQTFNRELSEVFKVLKLSRSEQFKDNVKNRFQFLDQMGLAFFQNLKSKSMLKAYVIATFSYFIIKHFL